MKTTQFALLVIVTVTAIATQNPLAQVTPPAAPTATGGGPQRPELTPGPRPLAKREQAMLKDARLAYAAQAKNDTQTFLHYMADEYFTFDSEAGKLLTKDTWRQDLTAAAARRESTIRGNITNADGAPELGKQETLVLAGDTAIFTGYGEFSADGRNWVPVRSTTVWIYREGRWQRLTDYKTPVKKAGAAK
jgi:uncharacterized protein DUF4440